MNIFQMLIDLPQIGLGENLPEIIGTDFSSPFIFELDRPLHDHERKLVRERMEELFGFGEKVHVQNGIYTQIDKDNDDVDEDIVIITTPGRFFVMLHFVCKENDVTELKPVYGGAR